jgi:hypothetical protein
MREVRALSTKCIVAKLGGTARPGESKILHVRVLLKERDEGRR